MTDANLERGPPAMTLRCQYPGCAQPRASWCALCDVWLCGFDGSAHWSYDNIGVPGAISHNAGHRTTMGRTADEVRENLRQERGVNLRNWLMAIALFVAAGLALTFLAGQERDSGDDPCTPIPAGNGVEYGCYEG